MTWETAAQADGQGEAAPSPSQVFGILELSLAILALVALISPLALDQQRSVASSLLPVLGTTVACFLLMAALRQANDFLAGRANVLLYGSAALAAVSAAIAVALPGFAAVTVCGGLAATCSFLFWVLGNRAAPHTHFLRRVIYGTAIACVVFFACAAFPPPFPVNHVALSSLCSLASMAVAVALNRTGSDGSPLPTAEECCQREFSVRSNGAAALADGALCGFFIVCVFYGGPHVDGTLFADAVALLFAILLFALYNAIRAVNFKFEQLLRRSAPLLKAVPVMLVLFLNASSAYNAVALALSIGVLFGYLSMLCGSLVARCRLLDLSVFYVFGRQGAFLFAAASLEVAIGMTALLLVPDAHLCQSILAFQGILLVEWFTVLTLKRGTTFDRADSGEAEKRKGGWKSRVEELAAAYELTARQQEVLAYLAKGRNAQYIASQLCVSLSTAKSHIYNIYLRLGVHSQQELLDMVEPPAQDEQS